ncbi:metallophosphoesterase family protein [Microbacterium laevaniformans]|uniref:metallophosphoesterase family protein n=1 Tax=Microbacterium laevaniformans TaxID=36807 RepID=UPI003D99CADC
MKIFETAGSFDLPDDRVWISGDWHGNAAWPGMLLPAMRRHDRTISTVLQLGDFWPSDAFLATVDYWAERAAIEHVLFLPGNHEPWQELIPIEVDLAPGQAARISERVYFLPRPFRFTIGGRTVLALGGASSVDAEWRTPGADFWPQERITQAHEDAAVADGPADILLTHESPVTAVPEVARILASNPNGYPAAALAISAAQRERVERVHDAVQPILHFHGHMHVYGNLTLPSGQQIISLAQDGQPGNAGVLDLEDLSFELLTHSEIVRR